MAMGLLSRLLRMVTRRPAPVTLEEHYERAVERHRDTSDQLAEMNSRAYSEGACCGGCAYGRRYTLLAEQAGRQQEWIDQAAAKLRYRRLRAGDGTELKAVIERWHDEPDDHRPLASAVGITQDELRRLFSAQQGQQQQATTKGRYVCDICTASYVAPVPPDTATNQDVACPRCHVVETCLMATLVQTDRRKSRR